jgi:hypothetical protein
MNFNLAISANAAVLPKDRPSDLSVPGGSLHLQDPFGGR